ncbi:hypothetical protein IF2G_07605 [Cordyceps javanica]|nr:hypothetical protein IF2G_07605 [Cordyceps javanica]
MGLWPLCVFYFISSCLFSLEATASHRFGPRCSIQWPAEELHCHANDATYQVGGCDWLPRLPKTNSSAAELHNLPSSPLISHVRIHMQAHARAYRPQLLLAGACGESPPTNAVYQYIDKRPQYSAPSQPTQKFLHAVFSCRCQQHPQVSSAETRLVLVSSTSTDSTTVAVMDGIWYGTAPHMCVCGRKVPTRAAQDRPLAAILIISESLAKIEPSPHLPCRVVSGRQLRDTRACRLRGGKICLHFTNHQGVELLDSWSIPDPCAFAGATTGTIVRLSHPGAKEFAAAWSEVLASGDLFLMYRGGDGGAITSRKKQGEISRDISFTLESFKLQHETWERVEAHLANPTAHSLPVGLIYTALYIVDEKEGGAEAVPVSVVTTGSCQLPGEVAGKCPPSPCPCLDVLLFPAKVMLGFRAKYSVLTTWQPGCLCCPLARQRVADVAIRQYRDVDYRLCQPSCFVLPI